MINSPTSEFRFSRTSLLLALALVAIALGVPLRAESERQLPLAFPRTTLAYAETSFPEKSAGSRAEGADAEKAQMASSLHTLMATLVERTLKAQPPSSVVNESLASALRGTSRAALGITNLSFTGNLDEGDVDLTLRYLLLLESNSAAEVGEAFREAHAKGSSEVSMHESERFLLFRLQFGTGKSNDFSGLLALQEGLWVGIYNSQWILAARSRNEVEDAIDGLSGDLEPEETLIKDAAFKKAYADRVAVDIAFAFLSFGAMGRMAQKFDPAANAFKALGFDRLQSASFCSSWSQKSKALRLRSKLRVNEAGPPSWYAPLRDLNAADAQLPPVIPQDALASISINAANIDEVAPDFFGALRITSSGLQNVFSGGEGETGREEKPEVQKPDALRSLIRDQVVASLVPAKAKSTSNDKTAKPVPDSSRYGFEFVAGLRDGLSEKEVFEAFDENFLKAKESTFRSLNGYQIQLRQSRSNPSTDDTQSIAIATDNTRLLVASPDRIDALIARVQSEQTTTAHSHILQGLLRPGALLSIWAGPATSGGSTPPLPQGLLALLQDIAITFHGDVGKDAMTFDAEVSGLPEADAILKYAGRSDSASQRERAEANLRAIRAATLLYRAANLNSEYPASIEALKDGSFLEASRTSDPFASGIVESPHYELMALPKEIKRDTRILLAWQRKSWLPEGTRLVVFLNGEIAELDEEQFTRAKSKAERGKPAG